MDFVKVVGGTEIYNFGIQSFVHFSTKFWSKSISNKRSANYRWVGALCTARRASRLSAGRLGVLARTPPRPHAFPRTTPCPEVPRFYPAPYAHAPRTGQTADPFHARPYARWPRLCRTTAESTPSSRRHRRTRTLFKAAVPSPPSRHHHRSTAPPWPQPPNSLSHASPVPSELPRSFPIAPRT
jgi:hypothetical protein